jgi:hypothetical protein
MFGESAVKMTIVVRQIRPIRPSLSKILGFQMDLFSQKTNDILPSFCAGLPASLTMFALVMSST